MAMLEGVRHHNRADVRRPAILDRVWHMNDRLASGHARSLRSGILVTMLLSVLATSWANERKDRLEQVEALQAQLESKSATYKPQATACNALSSEQAKADRSKLRKASLWRS